MITFESVQELIDVAEAENTTISELTLLQTAIDMEISTDAVLEKMQDILKVMKASARKGLDKDLKSMSGLTGGMAYKVKKSAEEGRALSGEFISEVMSIALSVSEFNAAMGRIVAAPTAGSCGVLPACLLALQKIYSIPDEQIIDGILNASAIGMVIAKNASISGAAGGCQAECGSAAAMAASAITEIMGGTPSACGHAAAQALKSLMGLVCDPVAGLVEEPCCIRNSSSAVIAVISAQLALCGIESIIPIDEVIETMGEVGRQLPSCLRETAQGGIAITKTAQSIEAKLLAKLHTAQ